MRPVGTALIAAFVAMFTFGEPPSARAQSPPVVDPTLLQFIPSPDHNAVTRYQLEVVPDGAVDATAIINLGKPDPALNGLVTIGLDGYRLSDILDAGVYVARIRVTSGALTSTSTPSNPFTFSAAAIRPCSYNLSPTSQSVAAAGGTGSITIATTSSCAWTASSDAIWIAVAAMRGVGSGAVAYTLTANATSSSRSGTLTIAGQNVMLIQDGVGPAATPPSAPGHGPPPPVH